MQRKTEREIPLPGGRVTAGVVLSGGRVHRPPCANANFVHAVLQHLEMKNCPLAPRYIGLDEQGKEMLTDLLGDCPADLGDFSDEQCGRAMKILRSLHQELADFPGCLEGETVCHYDPSPCNFVFQDGLPCALIDWDAAGIGDPADDLAYAVWMRLDIGNPDIPPARTGQCLRDMLDTYGLPALKRQDFLHRIQGQMERVGQQHQPLRPPTSCRFLVDNARSSCKNSDNMVYYMHYAV